MESSQVCAHLEVYPTQLGYNNPSLEELSWTLGVKRGLCLRLSPSPPLPLEPLFTIASIEALTVLFKNTANFNYTCSSRTISWEWTWVCYQLSVDHLIALSWIIRSLLGTGIASWSFVCTVMHIYLGVWNKHHSSKKEKEKGDSVAFWKIRARVGTELTVLGLI